MTIALSLLETCTFTTTDCSMTCRHKRWTCESEKNLSYVCVCNAVSHVPPDCLTLEYLAPETTRAILAQPNRPGQPVASCQGDIFSLGSLLKALLFRPIISISLGPRPHPGEGATLHLKTKVSQMCCRQHLPAGC